MFEKCIIFFNEITRTMVASNNNLGKFKVLRELEQAFSNGNNLQDHYLYSDNYKLNLETLISVERQQELEKLYGKDWLKIVNGMYNKIEREVHDDTVRKLGGLKHEDEGGKHE